MIAVQSYFAVIYSPYSCSESTYMTAKNGLRYIMYLNFIQIHRIFTHLQIIINCFLKINDFQLQANILNSMC